MFPIDPLLIYIVVPAILVTALILIKVKQQRASKHAETAFIADEREEQLAATEVENEELAKPTEETDPPSPSASAEQNKPQNCTHYLGYLFMKKAPEQSHIPTECYECRRLLQCLYSPNVIEKVYGE